MCFAAEFPPSRQGSLITTHVAAADKMSVLGTTSSPQRQPLLDAESILPKHAAAMVEEAHNSASSYLHPTHSSPPLKHKVLDTIKESNEAILEPDLKGSQGGTSKAGGASVGTAVQAGLQQQQQQQQQSSSDVVTSPSEAPGLVVQSVQHAQTSGHVPDAADTTVQSLNTSVQSSAGVIAVAGAEPLKSVQQGADLERCDSMSVDSEEQPSSTAVEVSIVPDSEKNICCVFKVKIHMWTSACCLHMNMVLCVALP